jgi:hypothetical protein
MIDSGPRGARASAPSLAPNNVSVLLMVSGPGAASGYRPGATLIVWFGEALLMAAWIVMQGINGLVQLLASFPVGAT